MMEPTQQQKSIEDLLIVLGEEQAARRLQKRTRTVVMLAVIVVLIVIPILTAIKLGHFDWGNFLIYGSSFGAIGAAAAASRRYKDALIEIAELDDVRSIGPLIEALDLGDRDVQAVVVSALTRLLPRLKASDADLLTPEHHKMLGKMLKKACVGNCLPLVKVILQTLQQVGNESDLADVEILATLPAEKANLAMRSVIEAAKECLPVLKERIRTAEAEHMLLRASGAELSSEGLLRPASGSAEADPVDQLLRPDGRDKTTTIETAPQTQLSETVRSLSTYGATSTEIEQPLRQSSPS